MEKKKMEAREESEIWNELVDKYDEEIPLKVGVDSA